MEHISLVPSSLHDCCSASFCKLSGLVAGAAGAGDCTLTTSTLHSQIRCTKLLAFGGSNNGDTIFSSAEALDLTYGDGPHTWVPIKAMRRATYGHGAAALDGAVYLMGGSTGFFYGDEVSSLEVYYTKNDTFATKTSMVSPRTHFGVGIVQGLVCAGELGR